MLLPILEVVSNADMLFFSDNYSGCVAVTLSGTTCYLKTSFSSARVSPSVDSAVRYNLFGWPDPATSYISESSGCGSTLPSYITPGGASVSVSITSAGLTRSYDIHVPSQYNSSVPAPLIMAYHGNTETPATIEAYSGYSTEMWNPYGITVYPAGIKVRVPLDRIFRSLTFVRTHG